MQRLLRQGSNREINATSTHYNYCKSEGQTKTIRYHWLTSYSINIGKHAIGLARKFDKNAFIIQKTIIKQGKRLATYKKKGIVAYRVDIAVANC